MQVFGKNIYYAWDILSLYRQLWGQVGIPYSVVRPNRPKGGVAEGEATIEAWDGNTLQGEAFDKHPLRGQTFMMPLTINGFEFPIEPLVSVMGSKRTIETMLTGWNRDSNRPAFPIVEEVAMESYKVNIKGVFINDDNDSYPEGDVERLRWLLEQRGALPVTNHLLSIFGINYLCIKDFKCDAVEGHQAMQWYTIEAIADYPIELVLKET